jgi:hypothetical protein
VYKSSAVLLAAALTGASAVLAARPFVPPASFQSDLDAFMKQVLARRDENWKKLQQYVLDERELVELRGPSSVPIWGQRSDFTWYLRDGFFVRSPLKVNGVEVPDGERRKYEDSYLKRVKERDKRRGRGNAPGTPANPTPAPAEPQDAAAATEDVPTNVESLISQTRQPAFVDSAYFLKFKFEEGKYAFVGREKFDGRDVLRIEYYPTRLFTHEQDKQQQRAKQNKSDREQDVEATVERLMNKVSLVTLWVEPDAHQIVKYTFDNVNFDFLPAAWLLHVDDLKAAMTMSQPVPDVWLPRDVDMLFSATMAMGSFNVHYRLDYHDYRRAETSSRIRIGRGGE